jgi:hypothetical protein
MDFLNARENQYRTYLIEDDSVLTEVFFTRNRDLMMCALTDLHCKLAEYVGSKFKGRNGTARLGFNSERELFNIFAKIFGENRKLSSDITVRRILQTLWEAF